MSRLILCLLISGLFQDPVRPPFDFSKSGAGFYGAGREVADPEGLASVRIGVLGPEKGHEALQLRTGVSLAVEEANRAGGYRGRTPFEMVYRFDDGPWGAVTGKVVQLAYEDAVWAIIGGLDGQRTHIAELVVAKAWVPVVSPTAADSSVDYANVPWVFRCFPSDIRQADLLLESARARGLRRIAFVSELQREAHTSYLRFKERCDSAGLSLSSHLEYSAADPASLVPRLSGMDFDCIVLSGSAGPALEIIRAVRRSGIHVPVLTFSGLALPGMPEQLERLGDVSVAAPFDFAGDIQVVSDFLRRFEEKAGTSPTFVGAYAYDAARMIVRATLDAGLNRMRIRDALVSAQYDGITGHIRFDSLRGNTADPVLLTVRNGAWSRVPPIP
jgi:branched-chain amino acid transport system substrate-binding protein